MPSRLCPACRQPVIRAWISNSAERTFDAAQVEGGEWGIWSANAGLNVIQRARPRTPDNHFGTTGFRLHECAGRAGEQLELGGAA